MKTGAQTLPLVAGALAGLALMSLAYGVETGPLAHRWAAAALAFTVIIATGAAFYVWRKEVDLEKAGDGCYYLGLIFTLFSLIVVLSGFGAGEGVSAVERTNEVVSKFGVALSSTLAGVMVRVFLQNCIPEDLTETEGFSPERARAIYGDALSLATRRTLRELRNAETSFARVARTALMHAETAERRAEQAGTQAGENVANALEKMSAHVERVTHSIERLREETIEQRDRVRDTAAETKQQVRETSEALTESAGRVREAQAVAEGLKEAAANASSSVRSATEQVKEAGRETSSILKGRAEEAREIITRETQAATEELKKTAANASSRMRRAAKHMKETSREARDVIEGKEAPRRSGTPDDGGMER